MKHFIRSLFILFISGFLAAPILAATITVNMLESQFEPKDLVVEVGDTVKWVNLDAFSHTTTSKSIDADRKWDSKIMANKATFSFTFNTPGIVNYICTLHHDMFGKITVLSRDEVRAEIGKKLVTKVPKVVPIKLNLTGKIPEKVYLGSYIVNAQGSCADCHSCPTYKPGHNPFEGEPKQFNPVGYLAGGVAFGPSVVSRNITPISGKPAGMRFEEFKTTMRTGHSPNSPGSTLKVMPWPMYGMMSDYDLEAVFAYLKSVPPAQPPAENCATAGQ